MVQSREGCPHGESLRYDKWGVTAAGLHPALYLNKNAGHEATYDFTTFRHSTRTDTDRDSVAWAAGSTTIMLARLGSLPSRMRCKEAGGGSAWCSRPLLVALHSDSDGLGPTVRLARAGVSDQRGPRCCEESLAAF
jgi:hypothetical protein